MGGCGEEKGEEIGMLPLFLCYLSISNTNLFVVCTSILLQGVW